MSVEAWDAAMAELDGSLHWSVRRVNLLAERVDLPREPGAMLRVGATLALEVTGECNPCHRMDEIAPGLRAVLTPDWRGGVICRVIAPGDIAIGDVIEARP